MTLILTALSHNYIVQAADRRLTYPDGSLYDDDTNKAIFYCGRVAVAYTGLALMKEDQPTAEWIGMHMKDELGAERAMNRVAKETEDYLRTINRPDKRLAIVATGWATNKGIQPPLPFICVGSNFMTDSWSWKSTADDMMTVRYQFLERDKLIAVFVAGQALTPDEQRWLERGLRQAINDGSSRAMVDLLSTTIQSVAGGKDSRAQRVGKGMIIHLLTKASIMSGRGNMVVTPLTEDLPSFIYVSKEGKTSPFQGAVQACNGTLLTNFGGGTIPPGGKGVIRTEMEDNAKKYPIHLGVDQVQFAAQCRFCALGGKHNIVSGELPLNEKEAWINCRGELGHLLLLRRHKH